MFYLQATATAQDLFHNGDGTRKLLAELVRRSYEGSLTAELQARTLGMSPEALGAAVEAFAKR